MALGGEGAGDVGMVDIDHFVHRTTAQWEPDLKVKMKVINLTSSWFLQPFMVHHKCATRQSRERSIWQTFSRPIVVDAHDSPAAHLQIAFATVPGEPASCSLQDPSKEANVRETIRSHQDTQQYEKKTPTTKNCTSGRISVPTSSSRRHCSD